ncbi:DrmB family protein [Streptosporangium sp. NPDC049376]|uniref:DrmB family protein n=1 Tax=Streptosporangium sp. NPDC049376 TaxID=3366192 RepID=UPI003794DC22
MGLRSTRTRQAGANNKAEVTKKPLGAVRRAQTITTYGVGSMIAVEDQSYIVSGIDSWRVWPSDVIWEPRLQRWLNAKRFHLPPADEPPSGDGIKIRLFPEMYSCGSCKRLQGFKRFGSPAEQSKCGDCDKPLTPSRFVIACENGHLDDFPYFEWLHKKSERAQGGSNQVKHELTLDSTGQTASLRSVVITCSCGVRPASLEGAFGRAAMKELGIKCQGRRPWLGRDTNEPGCLAVPRTLQRGASAAWFGITRSALSIPPWSETLQQRINPRYEEWNALLDGNVPDKIILSMIEKSDVVDDDRFAPEAVLAAVRRRRELEASALPDSDEQLMLESANELRREEYAHLHDGTGNVGREENFECVQAPADGTSLPYGFKRSMLVKRLREVRALESFTRVELPDPASGDRRRSAMAKKPMEWLPAIEVSGEGVFLAVDGDVLKEWEQRTGPERRAHRIWTNHTALLRERAQRTESTQPPSSIKSPVTARYVLLHTLAHVLINEWSLDCGYPTAALRERLYVDDKMAGILIYTATSDSAGSLGGVVAQGEHHKLYETVEAALARTEWCSQDPPCMEAEANGLDSLNLAACYACVLLPETSCETNNVFLDRAMLIGTPEDPSTGFFHRAN